MADNGEHRMLFDLRGRRKNVVRVVYAVLAVLMALSLVLVVGPNITGIFDSGGTSSEAAKQFEDHAEKIERRLAKNPDDANLQLALMRQRIYAGNALASIDPQTGEALQTFESRAQLEQASEAWFNYLEATDEPNPSAAQLAANSFFSLAQASSAASELESNLDAAAEAQQIVADARPSLGTLSTLAIYQLFALDFAAAKRSAAKATKLATSKFERENFENQIEEVEKRARGLKKQLKEMKEYEKAKGQGKESLENPLGGLSGESPLGP